MSLRLIYGRSGMGKSCFCLEDIKSRIEKGNHGPLVFLVPEQFSFQGERNMLKTLGEGSILKAQVLSFKRMAYRVFNEVGGITRKHMDACGKSILVYRLMDKIKEDLRIFSRAAEMPGFMDTMLRTISEMKRYNITPDVLHDFEETIGDEALKNKLHDIGLIYRGYEEAIHENYIDSEDDLTMLAEKLEVSRQFDGAEIWMDEFASFTPQEYIIIEKLLKRAKRINITLCTDSLNTMELEETDIFSPVKNTGIKLIKLAGGIRVEVEKPLDLNDNRDSRFKESRELHHLEKNIFTHPYGRYALPTRDIGIFKSAGKYSEIEEAARDIVKCCREHNTRYRDIALVTRDLKGYENLIKAIFSEYGIPYFIDRKREIIDNPMVLLITSAVEILTHNWSYEAVFRYLKTGLLNLDSDDIDLLENYVLANGIKGRRWLEGAWDYRLNQGFKDEEITEYEMNIIARINKIKTSIIEPLLSLNKRTHGTRGARDICTAVYEFLWDIGIYDRIKAFVEDFKKSGELNLASEYSQIWNMIMGLLDQVVQVVGDEEMTLEQFLNIFNVGIGQYDIGIIPPAVDQVLVGSIERIKSHNVTHLYIVGVNDGVFPQTPSEDGLLSENDRESLRTLGMELASSARTRVFEEQFLAYTTLTIPGRYLRVSYTIADHEGKSMRPSIIVSRIKKIFPEVLEKSNIVEGDSREDNIERITVPGATFKELVQSVRRETEGQRVDPIWRCVRQWYEGNETWSRICSRIFTGLSYTNHVKLKNPSQIRKLYGKDLLLSISRIEKYAECPYSYFVQYGLKARDRKIYEVTAPDIGSLMHTVIDKFSGLLESQGMSWRNLEKDWCEEEIGKIVQYETANSSSILSSSKRLQYMTERLKRIITRAVWLIAQHIKRSGFEPIGYEVSFGGKGQYPPITMVLSSGEKIKLIGRIDRIDRMETKNGDYIRVIDYKSGNKAFKLSDVYHGLQIQLLVYLDAMLNVTGDKPLNPGGMLYFKVDDPIIKSSTNTADEKIEEEIMKKLKMKGLLLSDISVIKEMDREISGNSKIIPASITKEGLLGKNSSAATTKQFLYLRKHVKNRLRELCEEMARGNIKIAPYKKKGFSACAYCKFSPVCQFDISLSDNKYRVIRDMKDDEVWEKIVPADGEGEVKAVE